MAFTTFPAELINTDQEISAQWHGSSTLSIAPWMLSQLGGGE